MKKLLTLSIMLSAIACGKDEKATETKTVEEIIPVSIAVAEIKSVIDPIEATGVVSSKTELKLAFKTGGLIKKTYVQEGQFVNAGQLLAELDLSEIDAGVNQAQIGLQKSKRDYERVKKLYEEEAATKTNLQDASTGVEMAMQSVQSAGFNRKLSKIISPSSGIVLRKLAEQGELITPFAPVFFIGDGKYVVNVGMSDREIIKVNKNDKALIKLDAYPNENFKATVSQVSQTINPATGTYEVELSLDPSTKKIMSGFAAKSQLLPQSGEKMLVVPVSSLVEADQTTAFVFVYQGKTQRVSKREVKIGKISNNLVQIVNGLEAGEMIVNAGSGFLTDNQKVKAQ